MSSRKQKAFVLGSFALLNGVNTSHFNSFNISHVNVCCMTVATYIFLVVAFFLVPCQLWLRWEGGEGVGGGDTCIYVLIKKVVGNFNI